MFGLGSPKARFMIMNTKIISRALLACSFLFFSLPSLGWWGTGHEIIAAIAYNNLTPEAKKHVNSLLKENVDWPSAPATKYLPAPRILAKRLNNCVLASTWADAIKDYKWSNTKEAYVYSAMHFIDVPMNMKFPLKQKIPITSQCAKIDWDKLTSDTITNMKNKEVVSGTASAIKTLLSRESRQDKALALRFLIHFAGDAYMPFHALNPTFSFKDGKDAHVIFTKGANLLFFPDRESSAKMWYYNQHDSQNPVAYVVTKNWHGFWDGAVGSYHNIPEPSNSPYNYNGWKKWRVYGKKYRAYINQVADEIQSSFAKDPINTEIKQNASLEYWVAKTARVGCLALSSKYYGDKLLFEILPTDSSYVANVHFTDRDYKNYEDKVKLVAEKQIYIAGMHLAYLLNAIFTTKNSYADDAHLGMHRSYEEYIGKISRNRYIPTLDTLVDKILNR